ncbi:hypothetical protein Aduo_002128 [Ancylostoma duodenale]
MCGRVSPTPKRLSDCFDLRATRRSLYASENSGRHTAFLFPERLLHPSPSYVRSRQSSTRHSVETLSDCFDRWASVLLDEASMLLETVVVTLLSCFQNACFIITDDSKQLPPYVGTQTIPLAVELYCHSPSDIANRSCDTPTCLTQIVY